MLTVKNRNKIANAGLICAVLVVGMHLNVATQPRTALWWLEQFFHYGVCRIAVPFFFVCSGFFIARHIKEIDWYATAIHKRAHSLLVPYLVWATIYLVVTLLSIIASNAIHRMPIFSHINVNLHFFLWAYGLDVFEQPMLAPLWYIRALLLYLLITPLLAFLIKRRNGWLACLLLFVLQNVFPNFAPENVKKILLNTFQIQGLFYYTVGLWLAICQGKSLRMCKELRPSFALLMLGASIVIMSMTKIYPCAQYANIGWLPLMLWSFWRLVPSVLMPRLLRNMAFPIFLLHVILFQICSFMLPLTVTSMRIWCLKWILGVALSLVVAHLLIDLFPRLSSILFGGRVPNRTDTHP